MNTTKKLWTNDRIAQEFNKCDSPIDFSTVMCEIRDDYENELRGDRHVKSESVDYRIGNANVKLMATDLINSFRYKIYYDNGRWSYTIVGILLGYFLGKMALFGFVGILFVILFATVILEIKGGIQKHYRTWNANKERYFARKEIAR